MYTLSTNSERPGFFRSLILLDTAAYNIVQLFLVGNIALAITLVATCGVGFGSGFLSNTLVPFLIAATTASSMIFVTAVAAFFQYRNKTGGAWLKSRLGFELASGAVLLGAVGPALAVIPLNSKDSHRVSTVVIGWFIVAVASYYVVFALSYYFYLAPHFAPPARKPKPADSDEMDDKTATCCSRILRCGGADCCCCACCSSDNEPPPPWFSFPAFVALAIEWSLYVAAVGLGASSLNQAIGGVSIGVAGVSWIVASICLASVAYGIAFRNLLLILARIGCIALCLVIAVVAPIQGSYSLMIFLPLALLGIINELWRRWVLAGHLEQEEIALLLPVHTKNTIEIPQLLEEATRSNWAIDSKDVRFIRKIGTGGFGEVWIGKWKGTTAAIKKMHSMVSAESLREFCREASILATLRHPHVISLYGAAVGTEDLMLVMEYAQNGSLYDLLHNPDQHLPFEVRMKMGLDAAKGMEYLHSQDPIIIHRDLKSLNLLVMSDMTVKVSDFGTSKWIQQTATMTANVGSAMWSAPEVLRFSKYSQQADIYSFAIVMWELMTRRDVFPGMLGFQIAIEVGTKGLRPELPTEEECPIAEMSSLMQRAWSEDPHDRPSFSEIVNEMESILESMGGESHHSHC